MLHVMTEDNLHLYSSWVGPAYRLRVRVCRDCENGKTGAFRRADELADMVSRQLLRLAEPARATRRSHVASSRVTWRISSILDSTGMLLSVTGPFVTSPEGKSRASSIAPGAVCGRARRRSTPHGVVAFLRSSKSRKGRTLQRAASLPLANSSISHGSGDGGSTASLSAEAAGASRTILERTGDARGAVAKRKSRPS